MFWAAELPYNNKTLAANCWLLFVGQQTLYFAAVDHTCLFQRNQISSFSRFSLDVASGVAMLYTIKPERRMAQSGSNFNHMTTIGPIISMHEQKAM